MYLTKDQSTFTHRINTPRLLSIESTGERERVRWDEIIERVIRVEKNKTKQNRFVFKMWKNKRIMPVRWKCATPFFHAKNCTNSLVRRACDNNIFWPSKIFSTFSAVIFIEFLRTGSSKRLKKYEKNVQSELKLDWMKIKDWSIFNGITVN